MISAAGGKKERKKENPLAKCDITLGSDVHCIQVMTTIPYDSRYTRAARYACAPHAARLDGGGVVNINMPRISNTDSMTPGCPPP